MEWLFDELLPRFKQALSHLKQNNVFDTPDNCKILIYLLSMMNQIEIEYETLSQFMETKSRETLFTGMIKSYSRLAEDLYKKHHGAVEKKLDVTCQDLEEEDDEEEDEEKEDEEPALSHKMQRTK